IAASKSSSSVAAATPAEAPAPHDSPRGAPKWALAALAIVVLAGLIGGGWYWKSHSAAKLTEKEAILVADFGNTTGDPVFDGTLKQALAVQLEQAPYLNIVPDQTIRKALQFMGKPADERVTGAVARRSASANTSRR